MPNASGNADGPAGAQFSGDQFVKASKQVASGNQHRATQEGQRSGHDHKKGVPGAKLCAKVTRG